MNLCLIALLQAAVPAAPVLPVAPALPALPDTTTAIATLASIFTAFRLDLLLKISLAVVLGGAIGIERELSGKAAGLRTNILICVGSALLMDLSIHLGDGMGRNADPARLAAQVITGIGFLGAGTIMQARGTVIGLTTAATLWVVMAIGLVVGSGRYIEACGTALLVTVVNSGLGRLEQHFLKRRREVGATLRTLPGTEFRPLAEVMSSNGIDIKSKQVFDHPEDRTYEMKLVGRTRQFDLATSQLMHRNDVLSLQFD